MSVEFLWNVGARFPNNGLGLESPATSKFLRTSEKCPITKLIWLAAGKPVLRFPLFIPVNAPVLHRVPLLSFDARQKHSAPRSTEPFIHAFGNRSHCGHSPPPSRFFLICVAKCSAENPHRPANPKNRYVDLFYVTIYVLTPPCYVSKLPH